MLYSDRGLPAPARLPPCLDFVRLLDKFKLDVLRTMIVCYQKLTFRRLLGLPHRLPAARGPVACVIVACATVIPATGWLVRPVYCRSAKVDVTNMANRKVFRFEELGYVVTAKGSV